MDRRKHDSCADYNAFGYDPDGRIAWVSATLFGPDWIPPYPLQQFVGLLEPPRYGPPARYQRSCLPEGFTPNPPPDFYGYQPSPPYIDPPTPWDPSLFDAIRCAENFGRSGKPSSILRLDVVMFISWSPDHELDDEQDWMTNDQWADTEIEDEGSDDMGSHSDSSTEIMTNGSNEEQPETKDSDKKVAVAVE